jgi:hypothetical protein
VRGRGGGGVVGRAPLGRARRHLAPRRGRQFCAGRRRTLAGAGRLAGGRHRGFLCRERVRVRLLRVPTAVDEGSADLLE